MHCVHCTLLAWGSGRVLEWLKLVDRSTLPGGLRRESLVWEVALGRLEKEGGLFMGRERDLNSFTG